MLEPGGVRRFFYFTWYAGFARDRCASSRGTGAPVRAGFGTATGSQRLVHTSWFLFGFHLLAVAVHVGGRRFSSIFFRFTVDG
jgi:hypothetical protein